MWRPTQPPCGPATGAFSLRHITGYTTLEPGCGTGNFMRWWATGKGTGTVAGRPTMGLVAAPRGKAKDILAAVSGLKTIERENRPATAEERQALSRFPGFGPVALSIFPDPVGGHYKVLPNR